MKTIKPKTIEEAIDLLQQFLECDLYSKFKPEIEIEGETWGREDFFKNEGEFLEYIDGHFNVLRKDINSIKLKALKKKRQKLIKSRDAYSEGKAALSRLRSRNC